MDKVHTAIVQLAMYTAPSLPHMSLQDEFCYNTVTIMDLKLFTLDIIMWSLEEEHSEYQIRRNTPWEVVIF